MPGKRIRPFGKLKYALALGAALMCFGCFCGSASAKSLFEAFPFLKTQPFLTQRFDFAGGGSFSRARCGSVGVGNGRVFGLIGLDMPQNRISNITGPTYERSEEMRFYDLWTEALVNDAPAKIRTTAVWRARETAIVATRETTDTIALTTTTFAPRGINAIVRVAEAENVSAAPVSGLRIALINRLDNSRARPFQEIYLTQTVENQYMVTECFGKTTVEPGRISAEAGTLKPGETARLVCAAAFGYSADKAVKTLKIVEAVGAETLLAQTRDDGAAYAKQAMRMSSDDPFLNEMADSLSALLRAQEAEETGVVSAMARYSGSWCRDSFGPLRWFLLTGRFDASRRILKFYDLGTRLIGFRNRYPLNLNLADAPATFDWSKIQPQSGDDPNILILQYYWHYLATRDKQIVKEGYGFLRRNLMGQEGAEDFLFPFHHDETYQVFVMNATGKPMRDFYSADTSWLFAAAAEGLSRMAADIGKKDDAKLFADLAASARKKAEAFYWNEEGGFYTPFAVKETLAPYPGPFADINLHEFWIDYAPPSDPRARRNLETSVTKLWPESGAVKTCGRVGMITGMVPGYLLHALKKTGRLEEADRAYELLSTKIFSRLGDTAEVYSANMRPLYYGTPTSFRPWETAFNAEAILYYVVGLEFDEAARTATISPRLPKGANRLRLTRLYAGTTPLDIDMRRAGGVAELRIVNAGRAAIQLTIRIPANGGVRAALNGKKTALTAKPDSDWGRDSAKITIKIGPGAHAVAALPGI